MKKLLLYAKYFLVALLFYTTSNNTLSTCNKKSVVINIKKEEFEIPLTEDLMREHGILNRVLLIYEEIIKRIDKNIEFPTTELEHAIEIIKHFIEDYHEKLEENYIFPLFEKNKKEVNLVKTLKRQHARGRDITTQLKELTSPKKSMCPKNKKRVKILLQKFITMYRPHEAREDTVLFPQIRSLISAEEFDKLGEIFENLEHRLFGEDGFESVLKKVAIIEKQLGIYNLEQFTPVINSIHLGTI